MSSLTIENYLKTIYQLCAENDNRPALTGKLALALRVSPGTVTSMLKMLSVSGLAVYTRYEGVELTEAGRRLALRVLRRHRLIELFLVKTLNLTWDEVHEEAENMEHAVSDLLVDRIDAFLGYPATDPHGDPIPKADGTVATTVGVPLEQWPLHTPFRLVRVLDQSPDFLRYLVDVGLPLGAEAAVVASRPAAGVIEVQTPNATLTLAVTAAAKLYVGPSAAAEANESASANGKARSDANRTSSRRKEQKEPTA
ncbi:MAG: metal-dependent transcriptional regulator [Pirellulales bacterium]